MIEIRPFQPEDWQLLLDLANQAVPFAPEGNAEWLEYRMTFDEKRRNRRHYIATMSGTAAGYGCIEQQSDDPKWLRIYAVCRPEYLSGEVGQRLYGKVLQDAKGLGASHLWSREYLEDAAAREFFIGRGFLEGERIALPGQLPMVVYTLDLGG